MEYSTDWSLSSIITVRYRQGHIYEVSNNGDLINPNTKRTVIRVQRGDGV